MDFCIEHANRKNPNALVLRCMKLVRNYTIPLLLHSTKGGSFPFMTPDLHNNILTYQSRPAGWQLDPIMHVSLDTVECMANAVKHYGEKIALESLDDDLDEIPRNRKIFTSFLSRYLGYKGRCIYMTVRDPSRVLKNCLNEKGTVTLPTRQGNIKITAERYMDLMESFQPDIFQALSDCDTDLYSRHKRVSKSVERTIAFAEYCYQRYTQSENLKSKYMLAPIVGGYDIEARMKCIDKMKTFDLCIGYIFEGFHVYGESASHINRNKFIPIVQQCISHIRGNEQTERTFPEKLLVFPGAYTPPIILELICYGASVFDSSYAYCATINQKALTFHVNWFDPVYREQANELDPYIDITDDNNKHDVSSLLDGCKCTCCLSYSRAYLYHLYDTSELLGPTLLMTHNMYHMIKYFNAIQIAIEKNGLPWLRQAIENPDIRPKDYSITPSLMICRLNMEARRAKNSTSSRN